MRKLKSKVNTTWLKEILEDESSNPSSKRLIAMCLSLAISVCLIVNLFIDIKLSGELITGVVAIVLGCVGATSVDKFSRSSGAE